MRPIPLLVMLCLAGAPGIAGAQQKPAPPAPRPASPATAEQKVIAEGWTFLAQGDLERAALRAAQAAKSGHRNLAAAALSLEVEIARRNARAGLQYYERWLGKRALEEPGMLRRISTALLREEAAQPNGRARNAALVALATDGDAAARKALAADGADGGAAARELAAMGDEAAVKLLLAELEAGGGGAARTIEALGNSRSSLAIEPLTRELQNPRPEIRGSAAEALGRIGGAEAVSLLRPLLTDQSSFVRVKAAAALLRLDDVSGMTVLKETLTASEASPAGQLIVAEAMAVRPDAEWTALVKELTAVPEPEIRLSAARLIAPHDPEHAKTVLEALASDPNPAIREEATRTLGQHVGTDLTTLKGLLRHEDPTTRVGAAGRVLELTR